MDLLPIFGGLIVIGVWGYGLLDFSRTNENEMRTFQRPVWLLILLFGSVMGGHCLVRRRQAAGPGEAALTAARHRTP